MKTRLYVIINTYNRPKELNRLLDQLDCPVKVFDDGSDYIYDIQKPNVSYTKVAHHGKKNYWKLVYKNFQFVKNHQADYYVFLPDDIILKEPLEKAIEIYEQIKDPNKICLSLNRLKRHKKKSSWSNFRPVDYGEFTKTQFVDMCFLAERKFFEELYFKMNTIPHDRWKQNTLLGSGVGQQISKRLFGYNMYHTSKSLVHYPEPYKSNMNRKARLSDPSIEAS